MEIEKISRVLHIPAIGLRSKKFDTVQKGMIELSPQCKANTR